ncbi:MAG: hypothetical protein AABY22_27595, partial [Nanoarchaeota archaeon]
IDKPSLKESFGKAQDKCNCHHDHQYHAIGCYSPFAIFSCSHCSKKSVVNKGKLVVKKLSSKSPSVLGWEERFDKEFKVYQSAYEKYGKVKQYFGTGIAPITIDFPVKSIKSFISSLLLKQREKYEKKLDEWFGNGYKQGQGEMKDVISQTMNTKKEIVRELIKIIDEYKCDFNFDFEKQKFRHKSYVALEDIEKALKKI